MSRNYSHTYVIAPYRVSAGGLENTNSTSPQSGAFLRVQSVLYSTYTHSAVHTIHRGQDLKGTTFLSSSLRVYIGQHVPASAPAPQLQTIIIMGMLRSLPLSLPFPLVPTPIFLYNQVKLCLYFEVSGGV